MDGADLGHTRNCAGNCRRRWHRQGRRGVVRNCGNWVVRSQCCGPLQGVGTTTTSPAFSGRSVDDHGLYRFHFGAGGLCRRWHLRRVVVWRDGTWRRDWDRCDLAALPPAPWLHEFAVPDRRMVADFLYFCPDRRVWVAADSPSSSAAELSLPSERLLLEHNGPTRTPTFLAITRSGTCLLLSVMPCTHFSHSSS